MELDKDYDIAQIEGECHELWEKERIYRWDPDGEGPVFSVDTPPPYVSAAHLHVGHAMSYAQAEFVVRYKRMKGHRVYYPMGFDDNGLPTERYVEQKFDIKPGTISRTDFIKLCLEETRAGAQVYKELWKALGLSVDWDETYSTIDPRCQRTSQKSFLELARAGLVERRNDPILWCTHCRTSLSQADLESMDRKGKIWDVAFHAPDGTDLVIATTRPELIPACVAMYFHPEDARYQHLKGGEAIVPVFGHRVPIKTDPSVDPSFGTGLMMVCTFGDVEDVEKWRRDGLDLRIVVDEGGRMNELGGEFKGLELPAARKRIAERLAETGDLRGEKTLDQSVSIHERCSTPIEFAVVPQWFIKVLEHRDAFLKRGEELAWYPEWMNVRFKDWVNGLKWDWNISRQRFYGVPFPVWFCASCGAHVLADEKDLPVDPTESAPPVLSCGECGGTVFRPEQDVMDTWMTSSGTPLINAKWAFDEPERTAALYPMTVRVQAFEIIRTWLFYTVVKSHFHTDSLPWRDVMISGWGLNEQGKKISKRDLQKSTDASGYNRYDPYQVIQKYGADSLRYWATGAGLGYDLRYNERDVKAGKRLLTKLWNASRFGLMYLEGFDFGSELPLGERTAVDQWVWHHANVTLQKVSDAFERYDFGTAREAIDRFFWHHFCDNWLEMIKDRFWTRDAYTDRERLSAQVTLVRTLRLVLAMYAPFVPHVTEALYQRIFRGFEGTVSLHVSAWPDVDAAALAKVEAGDRLIEVLGAVRHQRTQLRLANSRRLESLTLEVPEAWAAQIGPILTELQAAVRADAIGFGAGEVESNVEGVRLTLVPAPEAEGGDAAQSSSSSSSEA